jgi:hypothetical protein
MVQRSHKSLTMLTAGGRITCRQCQAMNKRTRLQCRAPAISGKNVCRTHGGLSTGPRTLEGRQRCAEAKTVHGKDTRAKRAQNAVASAKLNYLRDLGNLLGMFTGKTGWPGRKPNAYRPPANPDPLELVRLIEALDTAMKTTEP